MASVQAHPLKYRSHPKDVVKLFRFLLRYRKRPEALEPFLDELKTQGVPEMNLANVRKVLLGWRGAYLESTAAGYRADRYLTAGMGAVDLVLLAVILQIGAPDHSLFIATVMLSISLVFVGVSLFISFARQEARLSTESSWHSNLMAVAHASGVAALTAAFWHIAASIGVLFLVLAVIAYVGCLVYLAWVTMIPGARRALQAAGEISSPSTNASNESTEWQGPNSAEQA